jgi:hypothetical protein
MKTVEIGQVYSLLENYDKNELPLILTRNGQPIAALFSLEGVDLENLSISINSKFITIIEQSRKSQKEEGRIFLEDIHLPSEI